MEEERDNSNGHKEGESPSMAALVENAMEEARERGSDEKHYSNRTFTAVEDKGLGVLPSILRAIDDTRKYRQELKTANWKDRWEASKAVAAIHERLMCGVDIAPIIDRIIAESAGVESARLQLVIQGLTHTEFTTNFSQNPKKHFWNKNKSNGPANNNELIG